MAISRDFSRSDEKDSSVDLGGAAKLNQIRKMLEGMPDDADVVLPAGWVRRLLVTERDPLASPLLAMGPEPPQGYSLRQVAIAFGRSYSRVWQWRHDGAFPESYRFRGEWHVWARDIEAFVRGEQVKQWRPRPEHVVYKSIDLETSLRLRRAAIKANETKRLKRALAAKDPGPGPR